MYEAVGNTRSECQEENDVQDIEYLSNCLQPTEAIRLLPQERRDGASRHCAFEPRPGKMVQTLLPREICGVVVFALGGSGTPFNWMGARPRRHATGSAAVGVAAVKLSEA